MVFTPDRASSSPIRYDYVRGPEWSVSNIGRVGSLKGMTPVHATHSFCYSGLHQARGRIPT